MNANSESVYVHKLPPRQRETLLAARRLIADGKPVNPKNLTVELEQSYTQPGRSRTGAIIRGLRQKDWWPYSSGGQLIKAAHLRFVYPNDPAGEPASQHHRQDSPVRWNRKEELARDPNLGTAEEFAMETLLRFHALASGDRKKFWPLVKDVVDCVYCDVPLHRKAKEYIDEE
jgi:hypothetical protein